MVWSIEQWRPPYASTCTSVMNIVIVDSLWMGWGAMGGFVGCRSIDRLYGCDGSRQYLQLTGGAWRRGGGDPEYLGLKLLEGTILPFRKGKERERVVLNQSRRCSSLWSQDVVTVHRNGEGKAHAHAVLASNNPYGDMLCGDVSRVRWVDWVGGQLG